MAENKPDAKLDAKPDEVAQLRAENALLRDKLSAAEANAKPVPNTRPQPEEPSFGISEGQRSDLERDGKTVSPFTSALQVGSGQPGDQPREVSEDEFHQAKPSSN
jgi:hypothetical protein